MKANVEDHSDKTRCSFYSENKHKVISQVPPGGCWSDIPEEIAKPYMKRCWLLSGTKPGILRRFRLDEPSYAVMTSPSSKYCDRCHPLEIRPFSIRENARLPTFPDEWEFVGNVSSKYRQVGNAVPVSLAKDIGKQIASFPLYSCYWLHASYFSSNPACGKSSNGCLLSAP